MIETNPERTQVRELADKTLDVTTSAFHTGKKLEKRLIRASRRDVEEILKRLRSPFWRRKCPCLR